MPLLPSLPVATLLPLPLPLQLLLLLLPLASPR